MSGQWETVTRKKDRSNGTAKSKIPNEQQQKQVINVLDDHLVNFYSSKPIKGNNLVEKSKIQSEKPPKQNAKIKQAPKQQSTKPKLDNKPKLQKSIEIAFAGIKVEDLKKIVENNKKLYSNTPIVGLRELIQFLNVNVKVEISDVVFSNKPFNYPLCAMPSAIKSVLETALIDSGNENISLFFYICLGNMANDMNKNLPALGYRCFIQMMLQYIPSLPLTDTNKIKSLISSYQNRQTIGSSILWSLGQAGFLDLDVGFKVFEEFMLPLIEMKNYTNYIYNYLYSILKHNQDSSISIERYMTIIEILRRSKKNESINEILPLLNNLLLASKKEPHLLVEPLIRITSQVSDKNFRYHFLNGVSQVLRDDKNSHEIWRKVHAQNLKTSTALLNHINQKWSNIINDQNEALFFETLSTLANEKPSELNGISNEQLRDWNIAITRTKNKMANLKKKSGSRCRFFCISLIILAASAVYLDFKQHGGWTESCTFKTLNNTGVIDYSIKAYIHGKQGTEWLHDKIEKQFPGFTAAVVDFVGAYIDLGKDLGVVLRNVYNNAHEALMAKVPVVVDFIETYAPGFLNAAQVASKNICLAVSEYYIKGKEFIVIQLSKVDTEGIQKSIVSSLEIGGQKVQEYYHWIYNKVSAPK